jgi:hypothetical protein
LGRLTRADWCVLAESVALAVTLEVALRVLSFSRLVRALGRARSIPLLANRPASDGDVAAARLARLAAAAYRCLPVPSTCLRVSLVLFVMLRRRGWPAELRIGVRKLCDTLDAHAWIEHDGVVVGSPVDPRYHTLPLPENRAA